MKESKDYWKESIISGIENYFLYIGIDDFLTDIHQHQIIPCLCMGEHPIAFQVHLHVEFVLNVLDNCVENVIITGYDIPERYRHGIDDNDTKEIMKVINDLIVNDINPYLKGKQLKFSKE